MLAHRSQPGLWNSSKFIKFEAPVVTFRALYLFFGLGLLHNLTTDFDTRRQNGSCEVCHINALEMTNLLGSWEWKTHFSQFPSVMLFILKVIWRFANSVWPVLSGMVACSWFLSFLNSMFPNWSTVETTLRTSNKEENLGVTLLLTTFLW